MGATPTGATPTGPTLDPLNILVNKFNIATHVALILFLFSSWINYLLYDTKSVMVFWQLLSKIKRFVTIFRISWNGPTLFNIPIGDFPPQLNKGRRKHFFLSFIFLGRSICTEGPFKKTTSRVPRTTVSEYLVTKRCFSDFEFQLLVWKWRFAELHESR